MASKIVPIRLNDEEQEMLSHICTGKDGAVSRNPSEMLRLLLRREFLRRTTGRSVVPDRDVSSEFRNGRPRSPDVDPTPLRSPRNLET